MDKSLMDQPLPVTKAAFEKMASTLSASQYVKLLDAFTNLYVIASVHFARYHPKEFEAYETKEGE